MDAGKGLELRVSGITLSVFLFHFPTSLSLPFFLPPFSLLLSLSPSFPSVEVDATTVRNTLIFFNVMEADRGTYRCTVSNINGTVASTASLQLLGRVREERGREGEGNEGKGRGVEGEGREREGREREGRGRERRIGEGRGERERRGEEKEGEREGRER